MTLCVKENAFNFPKSKGNSPFYSGFDVFSTQAHNLKVVGSNPTPATNYTVLKQKLKGHPRVAFCFSEMAVEALWKQQERNCAVAFMSRGDSREITLTASIGRWWTFGP